MNNVIDFEEEEKEMGSLYHSNAQSNLNYLLHSDERLAVFVELSIDASACGLDMSKFGIKNKDELKPDVCVYLKTSAQKSESESDGEKRLDSDIIRVPKPPALVIEILSPSQSVNELLRKLDAYFAMGVQSAWLVIPSLEEIKVFSAQKTRKNFEVGNDEQVIDETLDISLPIKKIFELFTP